MARPVDSLGRLTPGQRWMAFLTYRDKKQSSEHAEQERAALDDSQASLFLSQC